MLKQIAQTWPIRFSNAVRMANSAQAAGDIELLLSFTLTFGKHTLPLAAFVAPGDSLMLEAFAAMSVT